MVFAVRAFVEPEWIVCTPTTTRICVCSRTPQISIWVAVRGSVQYGDPTQVAASSQITGATDTLWGKPVHVTSAVGAGTAIVGSSQIGSCMEPRWAAVEVTNAHNNYFVQDLVAIRAERRLALTVFRPGGFCEVHLA